MEIMEKICYQYYNHSPRMHVNITQEVSTVPIVGDIITVCEDEFYSLNKKIADKNNFIKFKVVSRETRAVYRKTFYSNWTINLELIDINILNNK